MTSSAFRILESQILYYHKNNLATIPLKGKKPFTKQWQAITLEQSKADYKNGVYNDIQSVGFVIPENIVVVDVDNHNGDNTGFTSLLKLQQDYSLDFVFNPPYSVNTANNGKHLYYKIKEKYIGKTISNCLANYPCIEFKSKKRQVVIPESTAENGKIYKRSLLAGEIEDLHYLPDSLMEHLLKNSGGIVYSPPEEPVKKNLKKDASADIKIFSELLNIQNVNLPGNRSNNTYKLACMGYEQGLSKHKITEMLSLYNQTNNQPALKDDVLHLTIKNAGTYKKEKSGSLSIMHAFSAVDGITENKKLNAEESLEQEKSLTDWKDRLVRSGKDNTGAISRTAFGTQNTELFLSNLPEFKDKLAVNVFSMDTVWKKPAPWHKVKTEDTGFDRVLDDDDLIMIKSSLNKSGFDPNTAQILEAARMLSLKKEYHPVKQYLKSLAKWDGQKRLERFFPDYCGSEDNKYTQQIGRKIFTAIVARIYSPGCKFDYLPILIGKQGIGKSTLLETIAIKSHWYTDNLGSVDNKDVILRMRSKLIVENAELTMFDKTDPNQVKAFLSRRVDRDRLPYDRLPRDLERQCVIIATTNKDRFLQDETGNRRMWPVELHFIDSELVKADLEMLYAEALQYYKAGELLYLDNKEAEQLAVQAQTERYSKDDWQGKIEHWLTNDGSGTDKLTITDIWEDIFQRDIVSCGLREQKRIGNILRHMGWVRATIRKKGSSYSGFKKNA